MRALPRLMLLSAAISIFALSAAQAQDWADEDYTNKFFGTSLILTSPVQVVNPETGGWWTDSLPQSLLYDSAYMAGMINAWRMQNGSSPLLDPAMFSLAPGYEVPVEGGFEYNIDFPGVRPSEVEMILTTYGGSEALLAGTTASMRPLRMRYFSAYGDQGNNLELDLGVTQLSITPNSSMGSLRSQIEQTLREYYGPTVVFDLYYSQYSNRDGTGGSDISLTIEIPDPNAPPVMY